MERWMVLLVIMLMLIAGTMDYQDEVEGAKWSSSKMKD